MAPRGSGAQVRDHGHVVALETLVKGQASAGGRPHRRKERIPPGPAARTAAQALRDNNSEPSTTITDAAASVIDLAVYERAAQNRNTL